MNLQRNNSVYTNKFTVIFLRSFLKYFFFTFMNTLWIHRKNYDDIHRLQVIPIFH